MRSGLAARRPSEWLALVLFLFAVQLATAAQPVLQLKIGTVMVKAELAATEESRERGLMFRDKLGKDEGMLFAFDEPAYHAMWMKNTLIPLSVAFMDGNGKILNIEEMEPQTEITHMAAGPARYALEMTGGWFAAHKIAAGAVVVGFDRVPARK